MNDASRPAHTTESSTRRKLIHGSIISSLSSGRENSTRTRLTTAEPALQRRKKTFPPPPGTLRVNPTGNEIDKGPNSGEENWTAITRSDFQGPSRSKAEKASLVISILDTCQFAQIASASAAMWRNFWKVTRAGAVPPSKPVQGKPRVNAACKQQTWQDERICARLAFHPAGERITPGTTTRGSMPDSVSLTAVLYPDLGTM